MKTPRRSGECQEAGKTKKQSSKSQTDPLNGQPFRMECSDALSFLRNIPSNSIHSMVSDPPSGIAFMKVKWDSDLGGPSHWIKSMEDIFKEAYRSLKPGAYGLVWALPRTSHRTATALENAGFLIRDCITHVFSTGLPKGLVVKEANLPGFAACGTTLKPASEHWWLVQKPTHLTVLQNLRIYETGALNLPACAIVGEEGQRPRHAGNFIHDGSEDVRGYFPDAGGQLATLRADGVAMKNKIYGKMNHGKNPSTPRRDSDGSAARFFYVSKASPSDRIYGLDPGELNIHPTVKSIALMRWLCLLVTAPGGIVLDPFAGSGSTGVAALLEGLRFIGCEREQKYFDQALRRINCARLRWAL